jgi:hypothetical protein
MSAGSQIGREAQGKLEEIYQEINENWIRKKHHPGKNRFDWPNPYSDLEHWPGLVLARYLAADKSLGTEFLVIAMHAKAFSDSMRKDNDQDWNALKALVKVYKYSIRMFVLMRKVQYAYYYSRCPLAQSIGPINPYPLYFNPNLPHPHEVYISTDGNIKLCQFMNEKTKVVAPILNKTENEFDWPLFKEFNRPATWPKKWKYPWDPQYGAESETSPWKPCAYCKRLVVSNIALHPRFRRAGTPMCTCTQALWMKPIIIEIIEYTNPNYEGLNRGVRALAPIEKDDIIGEYVGKFFPLQMRETCGDEHYVMDFDRPPYETDIGDGWAWAVPPAPTAILASGLLGNWARFMNDAKNRTLTDAEFLPSVIGGKQRTVVETKKNIPFGK